MEEESMRQIKCPDCNEKCIKHGVLKSGSQRWFCKHCKVAFTVKINNLSKELNLFVNVNIRMYNFDDVQCTVIPSVAYGFVTGMNLQLC